MKQMPHQGGCFFGGGADPLAALGCARCAAVRRQTSREGLICLLQVCCAIFAGMGALMLFVWALPTAIAGPILPLRAWVLLIGFIVGGVGGCWLLSRLMPKEELTY